MATKEPLRRCVRCKTKKKGCSRGSPCERCALAGLSADECIYLETDSTYRNIKPKRKDSTPYTPKAASTTKLVKSISSTGHDPNAIVRCSRCIRTARGCSHERPCQPCREGGLSEWECRYTSASSFKIRGPGARDVRKIKSMEKIETLANVEDTNWGQRRDHPNNSAPLRGTKIDLDQIPKDYRTPSPPTNISPISEPATWRDRDSSESSPESNLTLRESESLAVPIPGVKPRFVVIDSDNTTMARTGSTTGLPAGSVEPPPMMTLIHSVSQQSYANTIPESSPAVYTDDYQSSPSPFNSPQFQSSPPIHFNSVVGVQRSSSYQNDLPMYPPQTPYRPPAGYAVQSQPRQYAAFQAHGAIPISRSPQHGQQFQNLFPSGQSPPYPQHQAYSPQHTPRPRAYGPRHASPGPYVVPMRQPSYHHLDDRPQSQPRPIPVRLIQQPQYTSYTNYGISPSQDTPSAAVMVDAKNRGPHPPVERLVDMPEQGLDYQLSAYDQEILWNESELNMFGQTDSHSL